MPRPYDVTFRLAQRLDEAGVATPGVDARLLVAHALGCDLTDMMMRSSMTDEELARAERLAERRAQGVPVQHLTGVAHFRYEELVVGPGVFVPRPETEELVGWALATLALRPMGSRRVVELCAGSGAISRSIARELGGVEVHAVEISDDALPYLSRNLEGCGVEVVHGDMAGAFAELNGTVDLVIANPPYVPQGHLPLLPVEVRDHDPHLALFSGEDGLDAVRVVLEVADRLLAPAGWVGVEHDETQSDEVVRLLEERGYEDVTDRPDLAGRPRFVTGQRPSEAR
ncbi:MAG TPA: peptide chain release factor N(5)-glutamine methyltransferase [Arachnia sp.]|nr:peptide chain release factor N(5)-glutamine methyltransferase [Arachnia sp.]HMT87575.1 peptide chain release factor N(5)-glutamine methyltransferase [Arachnia sp.]